MSQHADAVVILAKRYGIAPDDLMPMLRAVQFKGASDHELLALIVIANERFLNPLNGEIKLANTERGIVPIVSVDGWVRIVNEHPQFDGWDFEAHHDEKGLTAVTCRIHRKDRSHPVEITELVHENRRNTEAWRMPNRMARHRAAVQCARYAFGFGGIYDEDEAEVIMGHPERPGAPDPDAKPVTVEIINDEEAPEVPEEPKVKGAA